MSRFLFRAAVLSGLAGLWAGLAGEGGLGPTSAHARAIAPPTEPGGRSRPYDLTALRLFNAVGFKVKESYVDPKRIDPKLMYFAALEAVEKQVAEVRVEGEPKGGIATVSVGTATKQFDVSKITTIFQVGFELRDAFDFISAHLTSVKEPRRVEYAAINGMLSTLDPHSILLDPSYFKEMKLQTKGEFGGLGFVIQMKEGALTVVKVLKNTPAARGGIKKGDVITQIGNESTVNMDLTDAVSRLRGKPDSKVTISIQKPGQEPKPLTLARAIIAIESVESRLLPEGIGYVRLKSFQGNSARDIEQALGALEAKNAGPLKGLVFDLRGNPGGLLEQAVQVSDLFVKSGTIVSTVSAERGGGDVKRARDDGRREEQIPLAVLVNPGSASASEIVAGALKNLNRAVIVGRQTFGKGSVQVLYDNDDESALKLTIAQYLTPGDISIQEVGITPDVELIPAKVSTELVDVFAPKKTMGEADLEHHLTNPGEAKPYAKRDDVVPREKPAFALRYVKEEPKKAAPKGKGAAPNVDLIIPGGVDEDEDPDAVLDDTGADRMLSDYQVSFAHDLLLAAPVATRTEMVEKGKPFFAAQEAAQATRLAEVLNDVGIDWKKGAGRGRLTLEVTPTATATPTVPGNKLDLTLTVKNEGTEPANRVRAWSESEDGWLDRREFVFGEVKPGEKKSWTVTLPVPPSAFARRDVVTFKAFDDQGAVGTPLQSVVALSELPRPRFAYAVQVEDTCKEGCNGDGLVQRGETLTLLIDVKNVGTGKAGNSFAQIKNDTDENVFIDKGRFKLGELAPGESRKASFQLQVKKPLQPDTVAIKLLVIDEQLDEVLSDDILLPVVAAEAAPQLKSATLEVQGKAPVPLLTGASESSPTLATAAGGTVLTAEAKAGELWKVAFGDERHAWIRASAVKEIAARPPAPKPAPKKPLKKGETAAPEQPATAAVTTPGVELAMQHEQPGITLTGELASGNLEIGTDKVTLSGVVTDDHGFADLYVLANGQKVFFKPAGEDGKRATRTEFSTPVPLKPGTNTVVVIARENDELVGRKVLFLHRPEAPIASK